MPLVTSIQTSGNLDAYCARRLGTEQAVLPNSSSLVRRDVGQLRALAGDDTTDTGKIGSEKLKEQPIGLGPYRFVHYQPGVELVLEANTDYWRKVPHVKRLVLKGVPEATTRLAMLKKQEADVAYALFGALGEEVRRDANLQLEPVVPPTTQWIVFTHQQYDPKSPWYDKRVRLAANHAINRQAVNESETLGYSIPTGSIIPRKFDGALPLEPYAYDPKKAKQLLTEAASPRLRRWGLYG